MKDLIEALTIFLKYVEEGSYNERYPFHCEHDTLWVSVDYDAVSEEDKARLEELSFYHDAGGFMSHRFGSC